ncbi:monovalent cation/H(+) antiporter subunit G [Rhodobacteraceae bacterium 2376]|uniref:Monovalent cation/H(+) antiporter subunit G n=1 Tax=Rhabdonatronobacter sediminivivens TaxID=2743469 RepID=A0A7Z0I1A8_9RHOB|nr:monovalent cation/H(+) antiporter subunit G [Rhabdonatronobacter sediminivivens]NYS26101.1 monovalent cation/H(+) antiporter subunit G [Rhabdonatronobacter sediminivivens]
MMQELIAAILIALGTVFFIAGTLGLLRFPDIYCRLHALTKADGLGLGLIALGAAVLLATPGALFRIALIWVFVALASATCGHLVARYARQTERTPRHD